MSDIVKKEEEEEKHIEEVYQYSKEEASSEIFEGMSFSTNKDFVGEIKKVKEIVDKDGTHRSFYESDEEYEKEKKESQMLIARNGLSSQQIYLALGNEAKTAVNELLISGTKGGGKSFIGVFDCLSSILSLHEHKLRYLIFRTQHGPLIDVKEKIKLILSQTLNMEEGKEWKFLEAPSDYKFVFANGSELLLRGIANPEAYRRSIHGVEIQRAYCDELSLYPTLEVYNLIMTCLRYSASKKGLDANDVPLVMRASTNPWAVGIEAVWEYFVPEDTESYGKIYTRKIKIGGKEIKMTKLCLFSSWIENYKNGEMFVPNMVKSMRSDKSKLNAFMRGTKDTSDSSFFGSVFSYKDVMIKPFNPPDSWARKAKMAYDDGTKSPFGVIWYFKSDGSPYIDGDGEVKKVPKNSMFIFHEYLGCQPEDETVGLNLTHEQIADKINEINDYIIPDKNSGFRANCGPADSAIFANDRGGSFKTISDIFSKKGLRWVKSLKGGGSRSVGAALLRNAFQATKDNSTKSPHIYFFNTLKYLPDQILSLRRHPKDPDDVDNTSDKKRDHLYDPVRYALVHKDEAVYKEYY